MSAVPGLGNANIRLVGTPDPAANDSPAITVEMSDDTPDDLPIFDDKNNIVRIKHGDGSVTVSLDGTGLGKANAADRKQKGFFKNLVEDIDASELSKIVDDLMRGIDDDLRSRKEWIEDRAAGIKLLGLKSEVPNIGGAGGDSAPVEGMSKVRHPLMLEAVLRFQANARSELLPTDGPVKIRNDDNNAELKEDLLANSYQKDMNHYLTAVATEYYPDTDRMLLLLGFGGTTFKKVYFCPIRNRPVSESVDADDIIVNQSATDLPNARRVTHRAYLRPSTVKRLQILGVYRDVDLNDSIPGQPDAVQEAKKEQQGITVNNFTADERDREIYECCCELDIKGFEHKVKNKASGLEIPYKVTIDRSSRTALAVVRNYEPDDEVLPTARKNFVKYTFIPGLGFYDIGLFHILGNTTNAVTAAWRVMLDNGMFSNFPGFLIAKAGTRQNTNIFRVPPGGGAPVDTGGMPISQAVMPLPYNTSGQPALMDLVQDMVQTGQRVGGTAELQVGEGREEAPVGTTMALIDQAVKVLSSVHKRLHSSQAEEFQMLVKVFKENPESFWQKKCASKTIWDVDTFMKAANNCDLVPQADPNTASMGQRMMKIMGLKQLQAANGQLYDPIAIDTAALIAMGWSNPDQFFVPKSARGNPPPELQEMQTKMANETQDTKSRATEAQAKLLEAQAQDAESKEKISSGALRPDPPDAGGGEGSQQVDTPVDQMLAQSKLMDSQTKRMEAGLKARTAQTENQNRDQDREAAEREAALELARALVGRPSQGESGKQVGTDGIGAKTNQIIKDVDKGLESQ